MKKNLRHLSRQLAVQALYYNQTNPTTIGTIEDYLSEVENETFVTADYKFTHFLIEEAITYFDIYLSMYQGGSHIPLTELDYNEKSILVLAVVELKSSKEVPAKVIVNEAIELAKELGATDSYKYINGLVNYQARLIRPAEFI